MIKFLFFNKCVDMYFSFLEKMWYTGLAPIKLFLNHYNWSFGG